MKRYLVFAGEVYYPAGGWNDFIKDFDSETEATEFINNHKSQWAQVIDTQIGKEVDSRD